MAKAFIRLVVRIVFFFVGKVEIVGIENIPLDQKFMITTNHIGYLDAFLMVYWMDLIGRDDATVIVAEKYEQVLPYRWAVRVLDFQFIDRENPDLQTMREVIRRLKKGGFMVIAPEGTRSPNATLLEGKRGAAFIAAMSQAYVLPAGLTGTEDSLLKSRLLRFRRLNVRAEIGRPYKIPKIPKEKREEFLQAQTDEIMCRIAALLPPSYRGIYADHPRLQQILTEGGDAPGSPPQPEPQPA